jgi:general secretion pathway protein F
MAHGRDERAIAVQLRRQRMVPVRTLAVPGWIGAGASRGKVPLKDQGEVHQQLAQLLGRGVPLVEALTVVEATVSARTRPRVTRVREMVSSGSGFAAACASTGLFDVVTNAVYSSAERTGDLGGAAEQLSRTTRRQMQLQGKALTLLLYPLIVLCISFAATIFLLVYVVPKVGDAMQQQMRATGKSLPWFTQWLMAAGVFLRDQWMFVVPGVAVLGVLAFAARKSIAATFSGVLRRVPLAREVVLTQESARFFTVMAAMTRTGIPLADALGVATNAIGHPQLRSQLTTMRAKLIEGGVLRHLIDTVTALPLGTRRLLIAAERSGDMEKAFDTLAGDMTDELDRRTTRLLAAMEPLLIVFMAVVIGTVLLSIMIPILNLSGEIA